MDIKSYGTREEVQSSSYTVRVERKTVSSNMGTSDVLKKPHVLLKILELALAITCSGLVLHAVVVADNLDKVATIYVTIMGFIMVNIITLMSFVLNTPLHKMLQVAIAVVGAIMFTTSGALMLDHYINLMFVTVNDSLVYQPDRYLACGIIAIINAAVYLVDAALTFKQSH